MLVECLFAHKVSLPQSGTCYAKTQFKIKFSFLLPHNSDLKASDILSNFTTEKTDSLLGSREIEIGTDIADCLEYYLLGPGIYLITVYSFIFKSPFLELSIFIQPIFLPFL